MDTCCVCSNSFIKRAGLKDTKALHFGTIAQRRC